MFPRPPGQVMRVGTREIERKETAIRPGGTRAVAEYKDRERPAAVVRDLFAVCCGGFCIVRGCLQAFSSEYSNRAMRSKYLIQNLGCDVDQVRVTSREKERAGAYRRQRHVGAHSRVPDSSHSSLSLSSTTSKFARSLAGYHTPCFATLTYTLLPASMAHTRICKHRAQHR